MRAIAKAEGFDVKFINTPWEGIFATVDKGDRDIIMSGITITDKRKQVVDFSKPYFLAHQLILTDKSVKINKLSDLSKGSVAVGVAVLPGEAPVEIAIIAGVGK